MRRPLASLMSCLAVIALAASARATNHDQIAALFRPFLAEQVTLAPDGRHVAYTEHVKNELNVIIMSLEPPYAKLRLLVADDQALAFSKEKQRAQLRFLRWATPNRLVFAPDEEVIPVSGPSGPKYLTPILAVDADGNNPRTLVDAPDLVGTLVNPGGDPVERPRHTRIVGFMPGDRDHFLVQAIGAQFRMAPAPPPDVGGGGGSGGGPSADALAVPVILPTTLFKVDVHTGKLASLGDEFLDGGLGYDRQGRSRISYAQPKFSLEHPFALLGTTPLKFSEAWLGSLAGNFTITPRNYFGERAFPLGFDVDPDVLYVASNIGRDTFGVYAFNLKTKQRTDLALEDPHVDLAPLEPTYPTSQLVFDEFRGGQLAGVRSPGPKPVAVWRDPELTAAQRALEKKFPARTVELLEWSEARTAFLIRVTGGTEPGRYFVWQKPENLVLEILRRAPWLAAADLHATEFFEFVTAAGVHLTGYLTLPRTSRLKPPPAVIRFADGFPGQAHAEFDREAQVLAAMGFVVIRLNHRGVGGFGIKHREAILAGIDRVPVDDALAAVDWVAARHPIDRKRVATMGLGFGGYLAVRAVQLHPEAFRCAVAFNAPLDLAFWLRAEVTADMGTEIDFSQEVNRAFLQRGPADLRALSVLDKPETLINPVFLLADAGGTDATAIAAIRLRDQVRRQGGVADYIEVNADFAANLPDARAAVYDRLEEFFNLNLYDYKVKIGPTKEIK